MFGIKMRETDVWAGKKRLTYFVSDDADFVCRGTLPHSRLCFGVDKKYRRIFGSTEEIQQSPRGTTERSAGRGTPQRPTRRLAEVYSSG